MQKIRKENELKGQALRDVLSHCLENPESIPADLLQQIDDITRASSSPSAINSTIVGTEHSALVGRYISPSCNLRSLQGLTVTHVFVQWHWGRWYAEDVNETKQNKTKQNRNTIKFVVEYFSLFLEQQIPPLPGGVTMPGVSSARHWKEELKAMSKAAWQNFCDFYVCHGGAGLKSAPSAVSPFKIFMSKVDHETWPIGPAGESPFQHPDAAKNPRLRMKTRKDLVENQEKNKKSAAKKATTGKRKRSVADDVIAED